MHGLLWYHFMYMQILHVTIHCCFLFGQIYKCFFYRRYGSSWMKNEWATFWMFIYYIDWIKSAIFNLKKNVNIYFKSDYSFFVFLFEYAPCIQIYLNIFVPIASCNVLTNIFQVGLAFLAGLAFALILIPINRWLAKKIGQLSTAMMEQKDNRVKVSHPFSDIFWFWLPLNISCFPYLKATGGPGGF